MKDFLLVLKRFVPPYKRYMVLNIVFNILSAILNLFSFALIIPILQILFKINESHYVFMDWNFDATSWDSWKALPELAKNNFFWYVSDVIETHGGSFALIMLGLFLIVATLLMFTLNLVISCCRILFLDYFCATEIEGKCKPF